MSAGSSSAIAVSLVAVPAALSIVLASSQLAPVARVIDVKRPAIAVAAVVWAILLPATLAGIAGPGWLIPTAVFAWGGLAIALCDLAALRAPHILSILLCGAGVAFAASAGDARAIAAAATAIGAYVFLQAARLAFRRARGFDGMGGGDPGVMAALGAWLGPLGAPWALAVASVLGLAMVLAIPRLRHKRARLAFSPFLVVGAAVVAIVQAAFGADPFWSLGVAP